MRTATGTADPAPRLEERLDVEVLRYGRVWEDEALLLAALDVGPDDDVLSIASAGDNCLALLTAGARSVTAVDVSPAQLALVDLHRAALDVLSLEEHEVLVGLAPESTASRSALLARVAPRLEPTSRAWFERNGPLVEAGLAPSGRLDAYFGRFQDVVADLIGADRLDAVLHLDAAAVSDGRADAVVDDVMAEPGFTAWFADWFGRASMERHGRDPEQLRHVDGEVGPVFLDRFAAHLRRVPTATNPYAWRFLTGHDGPGAATLALRDPTRRSAMRDRLDRLRIVRADVADLLAEAPASTWSAANCSDLFEYLDAATSARLFELLADRLRPGGRVAWWNLLVERVPPAGLDEALLDVAPTRRLPVERTWFYRAFHVRHRAGSAGSRS